MELNFSEWKFLERKVTKQKLQTSSRFQNMLQFWWWGTMCPLAWIGLTYKCSTIPLDSLFTAMRTRQISVAMVGLHRFQHFQRQIWRFKRWKIQPGQNLKFKEGWRRKALIWNLVFCWCYLARRARTCSTHSSGVCSSNVRSRWSLVQQCTVNMFIGQ